MRMLGLLLVFGGILIAANGIFRVLPDYLGFGWAFHILPVVLIIAGVLCIWKSNPDQ
jgi:hypothetical protein